MKTSLKKFMFLILLISVTFLSAEPKTGTAAITSVGLDVSARVKGMGGTFIGLANDVNTLHYNPAGMININNIQIMATYDQYFADINYGYFGAVYPLKSINGAAGIQVMSFNCGEMDETTVEMPSGTGRTFSAGDLVVGLSYAQMLTDKFYVGGTIKLVTEGLANERVYTAAADIGTYYNTNWKSLIFGLSIRNFGGSVKFIEEEYDLPMTFLFGVSITPYENENNKVILNAEAGHPSDNDEFVKLGMEYEYRFMDNSSIFLRMGRKINGNAYSLKKENDADFEDSEEDSEEGTPNRKISGLNPAGTTLGAGIKYNSITFDYAWEFYPDDLGSHQMFSVSFGF